MDDLSNLTFELLRAIGRALKLRPALTKPEMQQRVAEALWGDGLRLAFAQLTELEQKAVAAALYHPHREFDHLRFQLEWGALEVQNDALLKLFLGRDGCVPLSLVSRLQAFVQPLPAVPLRVTQGSAMDAGLTIFDSETPALDDVRSLLRRAELSALKVSPTTGRLTSAGLKVLRKTLTVDDYFGSDDETAVSSTMRPYAWPLLLTGGKLVSSRNGTLELTKAGKAALALSAHEVIRTLWRNYLLWKDYDEFERIRVVCGQRAKNGKAMAPVPPRREAIARTLALCPMGEWIGMDELFRFVRASGHDFQVASEAWRLYVGGSPDWGSLGRPHEHGWDLLQGRYVLVFLMEYAATLGLVDLAYTTPADMRPDFQDLYGLMMHDYFSVYDGLCFVRLNALGAYCLGLTDSYRAPAAAVTAALSLEGTRVRALGVLAPSTESYLERIAERSDGLWTLTRESLQRAAEDGLLPQDVRAFLAVETGAALPYASEVFFRDVEQWLGRCRDAGRARLLRLAPAELQRVQKERKLAGLFLVAGEHLVIPERHEQTVLKGLKKLGYWVAPTYFAEDHSQPPPVDPRIGDDLLASLLG